VLLLSSILFGGDGSFERLDVESGYFYVSPDDVQLYASYAWRDDSTGEREYNLEIGDKALRMINNSQEMIVASVFLFDTIYGD
jgi:F0F1-type ATP synthase epsilon subunit